MTRSLASALLTVLTLCACSRPPAEPGVAATDVAPSMELPAAPTVEALTAQVREVYRQPQAAAIEALMHPATRACLADQPRYRAYLLRMEAAAPLPADTIGRIETIDQEAPLPFRGFEFPLRPTHLLRFELAGQASADGRGSVSQVVEKHAVASDGRWQLLFPCPLPEGLQRLREFGLLD